MISGWISVMFLFKTITKKSSHRSEWRDGLHPCCFAWALTIVTILKFDVTSEKQTEGSRLHWFQTLECPLNKPPVTAEATPRERTWCEFSIISQTQACIRFYGPSVLKQTLDAELANKLCQPCQLIGMTYCAHRLNHLFLYYREQPGICVLKHVC